MPNSASAAWRSLPPFGRGLGLVVGILGAIAILGPEAAHLAIGRLLGMLLLLGGLLGLIVRFAHGKPRAAGAVLTWSLIALGAGAVIVLRPSHGFPSVTLLTGLVLAGHGLAASLIALKGWRARDMAFLAISVAAPVLLFTGVALLFGVEPGARDEEILIGFDMLSFSLYLVLGRTILEVAESGPAPRRRAVRPGRPPHRSS